VKKQIYSNYFNNSNLIILAKRTAKVHFYIACLK